jgi:hypothetical protein
MAAVYECGGEWLPVPKPVPLRLVVRGALLNALAYTDGNQHEAATWLGLSERQLCYALKQHGSPGRGVRGSSRRSRRGSPRDPRRVAEFTTTREAKRPA